MPATCPACGFASPDGMRFCGGCGSPLVAAQAEAVTRRVATILFADVTGSTALGERVDPEMLRAIMNRYFTAMRSIIEAHGGTVEKFIGDAVMAVFGLPQLHEDDALRAVRAAVEIRERLDELNAQLQAERGFTIRFRTGVNTGEVVAGDGASRTTLVTGDTVNTAARLEQAAPPGEILIGHLTRSLVRDAVELDEIEPVAAKGKAEPLRAFRVMALRSPAGKTGDGRRAPMVGREAELASLLLAYRATVDGGEPRLVTVIGAAGVGKTRLVDAFLDVVHAEATVLRGRCLSYGAGITYWPIGEMIRAAAGVGDGDSVDEARARIRRLFGDAPDAAEREADISGAIGLSSRTASRDDISWAVRVLLGRLAVESPLVVVVEDIHWAEPTLLELLEEIVAWSRVALLIVCPARPDLHDQRPSWGDDERIEVLSLAPLTTDAVTALIDASPGRPTISDDVVRRVVEAADGNPLFAEELLHLLEDEGQLVVPPSIQALLAARIDRLATRERTTARQASVIGRSFQRAEVTAIAMEGDRTAVPDALSGLTRRQVIESEPESATADAYRFRHTLLREAAYDGLAKGDRARLHERFADWLEMTSGARLPEVEEIVAYHLEQAHRYLVELGEAGDTTARLGERAARRLTSAGNLAGKRADHEAAANLLERARRLEPDAAGRVRIGVPLAQSLYQLGRPREAVTVGTAVVAEAERTGLPAAAAHASLTVLGARLALGEVEQDDLWGGIRGPRATFEEMHDDEGLARVLLIESFLHTLAGDEEASIESARDAARHAHAAGDDRSAARALAYIADSLVTGARAARDAIVEAEASLPIVAADADAAYLTNVCLAMLHAMVLEGQRARSYLDAAEAIVAARGRTRDRSSRVPDGIVALDLGVPADAIPVVEAELERCRAIGDDHNARVHAVVLGDLRLALGDVEGARELRDWLGEPHTTDQATVACDIARLRAGVASADGDHASAARSALAAIDLINVTDRLADRGSAWLRLAEVRHRAGDPAGAADAARRSIELFTEKGSLAGAARAQRLLDAIA